MRHIVKTLIATCKEGPVKGEMALIRAPFIFYLTAQWAWQNADGRGKTRKPHGIIVSLNNNALSNSRCLVLR